MLDEEEVLFGISPLPPYPDEVVDFELLLDEDASKSDSSIEIKPLASILPDCPAPLTVALPTFGSIL